MKTNRILGNYTQEKDGPLFIGLAGIHGNEHAGIHAFNRVYESLKTNDFDFRGKFIGIVGNLQAVEQKARFIDTDLNRLWEDETIEKLENSHKYQLQIHEEREQKALLTLFKRLRSRNPNRPLILLDMHTTSAKGGIPFSIANDNDFSKELALYLGAPAIIGVENIISGTTLNYFTKLKMSAFGFEAGQHDNPESIDRMEAALWLTLDKIGCIDKRDIPFHAKHKNLLKTLRNNIPPMVEFVYRHSIGPDDHFEMKLGYKNFQMVTKGEVLAKDKNGPVKCPEDGMILMPLYQKQGEDGFFVVQAVDVYSNERVLAL